MKPNGRDYTTDPVLKRLADSDHATLILARRLHAQSPHAEDFQILDVHDGCDDNGSNQEHISDLSASQAEPETVRSLSTNSTPPPTPEHQTSTATPAYRRNVDNLFLIEPQSQEVAEVIQTATTEGQQREGFNKAEGTMAYKDLSGDGSKGIWRVRDNTTNKNLAKVVVGRAAALMRRLSSLTATPSTADSHLSTDRTSLGDFKTGIFWSVGQHGP